MTEEVLDRQALDTLRETVGNDLQFLAELLDTYRTDSAALLGELRQAVGARAVATIVRTAHTLKSTSATVGATGLAALCRAMEEAGRGGELGTVDGLLPRIEAAHAEALAALAVLAPQHGH